MTSNWVVDVWVNITVVFVILFHIIFMKTELKWCLFLEIKIYGTNDYAICLKDVNVKEGQS